MRANTTLRSIEMRDGCELVDSTIQSVVPRSDPAYHFDMQ